MIVFDFALGAEFIDRLIVHIHFEILFQTFLVDNFWLALTNSLACGLQPNVEGKIQFAQLGAAGAGDGPECTWTSTPHTGRQNFNQ